MKFVDDKFLIKTIWSGETLIQSPILKLSRQMNNETQ